MSVRTIDMTPTWAGAVEIYLMALEDGTDTGKEMAREEIRRMAQMLDQINEEHKAQKDEG